MQKKTLLNAFLLSSLMIASPMILAESVNDAQQASAAQLQPLPKDQKQASDQAIQGIKKQQDKKVEVVNESVLSAFDDIKQAMSLLKEDGKSKEAIKALQSATGKFEVSLAAEPGLGLVPIHSGVVVSELLNTPVQIEKSIETVIRLLKGNKVQLAREILIPMKDELVTETTYLPMATYPDAIKAATKSLIEGDNKAASVILDEALSTLVSRVSIVPLGLVRAEALIIAASSMDKEKEKSRALQYLDSAQDQLKIAHLLGYTDKDSKHYVSLEEQIKALKKEIGGGNKVEQLYEKLKSSFSSLVGKQSEQKAAADFTSED